MKTNENQWKPMKINENQWKSMKINEMSVIFTDFGVKQGSYAAAPAALDVPTLIQERLLWRLMIPNVLVMHRRPPGSARSPPDCDMLLYKKTTHFHMISTHLKKSSYIMI